MTQPAGPPLLELRRVHKRFGAVVVADGLDLTVRAGEALGIIGPNGAGKTSLLGLVCGDLRVDDGQVLLGGNDVTHVSAASRAAAGIGRSYQTPRLFGGLTTFENVLVGAQNGGRLRGRAAQAAAVEALVVTRLVDDANTLAEDLGLLGRRRLELARALATAPALILLDEIAAGLVENEVDELVETIQTVLAGGVAVVWIEHVVRALRRTVGRMACLHGGGWLAVGPPDEVLADAEVQDVYLGSPAGTS